MIITIYPTRDSFDTKFDMWINLVEGLGDIVHSWICPVCYKPCTTEGIKREGSTVTIKHIDTDLPDCTVYDSVVGWFTDMKD